MIKCIIGRRSSIQCDRLKLDSSSNVSLSLHFRTALPLFLCSTSFAREHALSVLQDFFVKMNRDSKNIFVDCLYPDKRASSKHASQMSEESDLTFSKPRILRL